MIVVSGSYFEATHADGPRLVRVLERDLPSLLAKLAAKDSPHRRHISAARHGASLSFYTVDAMMCAVRFPAVLLDPAVWIVKSRAPRRSHEPSLRLLGGDRVAA